MRILVDARMLHEDVGIGRYLRELVGRWLGREDVSRIRLLGHVEALEEWLATLQEASRAECVSWTDPVYSVRAQARWALRLAGHAPHVDVSFFPHYDVPLVRHPSPSVVTVHDLIHVRMPGAFPTAKRLFAPLLLDGALARATRVVAVSERTARDIRDRRPALADRVQVVSNGVGDVFRPPSEEERRQETRWDRWKPYLLCVATPRPHKNLELAVEVLSRVRAVGKGHRLLIVGPADERASDVMRAAKRKGVEEGVTLVGRVDDDELRHAYAGASVLLFPSLYEGFGLPPLEAMACGTPVLASPVGALPEILKGIGPLLDPRDPERWTRETLRLLDDHGERAVRARAGIERVAEYSWDRTAAGTMDVLRAAAGSAG